MSTAPSAGKSKRKPIMSLEQSKRLVERLWDQLVNRGRMEAVDEFVSPDFHDHTPLPGQPCCVNGLRQRLEVLHGAFPDFESHILETVAEGDKVVLLVRSSGTQQRDFVGMPPTGRRFEIQEIHILRLAGGRMVEHWGIPDFLGMLQQLGLASAPWDIPRQ